MVIYSHNYYTYKTRGISSLPHVDEQINFFYTRDVCSFDKPSCSAAVLFILCFVNDAPESLGLTESWEGAVHAFQRKS